MTTSKRDTPSVVRLGDHEAERLRTIRHRALAEAPDAFGTTLESSEARPMSVWQRQVAELPTFVAVLDGDDVGVVRGAPDDRSPNRAYLISMWVAPEARGRGVGLRLIDAVVTWARDEGYTELVLDVANDNEPAVALYSRAGFVPTGVTGTLPPPREHILEHELVLHLFA